MNKKIEDLQRYKDIGSKIKEARENAHISQKRLAKDIEYESATAISLIEAGERRISVSDLEKIAERLNKNIDFFLGLEKKANLTYALRADKKLSEKDKEKIFEFIKFLQRQ